MTEEVKKLVESLREDVEWAQANEWDTPITLGDNLEAAASMIESLTAELETTRHQLEQTKAELAEAQNQHRTERCEAADYDCELLGQTRKELDAWKLRAEAAERDMTSMLESCDCQMRHEYCARCYIPNQCNTDECTGYAKWRGPCAENGGDTK